MVGNLVFRWGESENCFNSSGRHKFSEALAGLLKSKPVVTRVDGIFYAVLI
jgi:hypothetical protein